MRLRVAVAAALLLPLTAVVSPSAHAAPAEPAAQAHTAKSASVNATATRTSSPAVEAARRTAVAPAATVTPVLSSGQARTWTASLTATADPPVEECNPGSLSEWGEQLRPGGEITTGHQVDCRTFTTDEAGAYVWHVVLHAASGYLRYRVLAPDGTQVGYGYSGLGQQRLQAHTTYRLVVDGGGYDPPVAAEGTYLSGVYDVAQRADCTAMSASWQAEAASLTFGSNQGPLCRTLSAAGPDLRYTSLTGDGISMGYQVFDADGAAAGTFSTGPASQGTEVKLTGSGPWTVVAAELYGEESHTDLWLSSYEDTSGCPAVTTSHWGEPLGMAGSNDQRPADCWSVTPSQGVHYSVAMSYTGIAPDLQVHDGTTEAHPLFGGRLAWRGYGEADFAGGHAYLIVAPRPADREHAVGPYRWGLVGSEDPTGCPTTLATSWDDAGLPVTLQGDGVACHLLDVPAGHTLRVGDGRADDQIDHQILNADNTVLCAHVAGSDPQNCRLDGPGPFRVVSHQPVPYRVAARSARVQLYDYRNDQGCSAMPLGSWGQAAPATGTVPESAVLCRRLHTDASAHYLWTATTADQVIGTSPYDVRTEDGQAAYDGTVATTNQYRPRDVDLEPDTDYVVLFAPSRVWTDPNMRPTHVRFGLYDASASAGCTAVSTAWDAPSTSDDVHGGGMACDSVDALAGAPLRVVSRSASVFLGRSWYDGTGRQVVCNPYGAPGVATCTMTGPGPYHAVTFATDAAAETHADVWYENYADTDGCRASSVSAWDEALHSEVKDTSHPAACWTISSTPGGPHLLDVSRGPTTDGSANDEVGAEVVARDGSIVAATDRSSSEHSAFTLAPGVSYRVLVRASDRSYDDPITIPSYHWGVLPLRPLTGCLTTSPQAWSSPGLVVPVDGTHLGCRQITAVPTHTLRLDAVGSEDVSPLVEVFASDGAKVCSTRASTTMGVDCSPRGVGPWTMVVDRNSVSDVMRGDVTVYLNDLQDTSGCLSAEDGVWGQPLPVTPAGDSPSTRCWTFDPDQTGYYAFVDRSFVADYPAQILDDDAHYARGELMRQGTIYRVLLPSGPPRPWGLYGLRPTSSCPKAALGWGQEATPATTVGFGPTCREIDGSAGDTFRLLTRLEAPPLYSRPDHSLLDTSGSGAQCVNDAAGTSYTCTLLHDGPAFWITADRESAEPRRELLWGARYGDATSCPSLQPSPLGAASTATQIADGRAFACTQVTLSAAEALVVVRRRGGTSTPEWHLSDGHRDVCSSREGHAGAEECRAPAGTYYLVVVDPGSPASLTWAVHPVDQTPVCPTVAGFADGRHPRDVDVDSDHPVQCIRFAGTKGLNLWITAKNSAGTTARLLVLPPYDDFFTVSEFEAGYAGNVQTLAATGTFTAVAVDGLPSSSRLRFSARPDGVLLAPDTPDAPVVPDPPADAPSGTPAPSADPAPAPIPVTPTTISATSPPTITGRPRVRGVLQAHLGTWSSPPSTVHYTWLRDGRVVGRGPTYRVRRPDRRHRMVVVADVVDGQGRPGQSRSTPVRVR